MTFGISGVRPAVHLNLKAADEATKLFEVTVNDVTTKYFSIEEAFTAANNSSTAATVKMLADAQTTDTLTVSQNKNITLDLNGHMLKYNNDTETASVIIISRNATFTLIDSDKLTTHTITSPATNEEITINGGLITGGTANNGGGVNVRSGTFIMEGGTISGNTAAYNGGGVFVEGGTFKMSGGAISDNTAASRGGVLVDDGYDGNAVVDGRLEVSGTPVIIGNRVSGNNNNARYLSSKIIVTGELTDGAKIGVNNIGEVATGFTQGGNPSDYFIPDDPANDCVYASSGTVNIGTHAWNDGEVTTQPTCTGEGEKTFTCTNCNTTKTEPVDALGHTLTHHEAKPATEEEDGNTEYWSCDDCENYFSDENGERVIEDKTTVILIKLTPAPAQPKAGLPWWAWLLIVLAVLAVVGVALGVWLYKKNKEE